MLKKVTFFDKKWQVVGRPDSPLILPVKSKRFFARALSFGHFLKDFFLLFELGTKDNFNIIERDEVTNGRRTVVPSRVVSSG